MSNCNKEKYKFFFCQCNQMELIQHYSISYERMNSDRHVSFQAKDHPMQSIPVGVA